MSAANGAGHVSEETTSASADKGKGRAVDALHDEGMDMDDGQEEESEESGPEDAAAEVDDDEEDEDDLAEIDTDNIVSDGRRTRGKVIDYAAADKEQPPDDDEDEEDDDDFEDPEADDDRMQE